MKKFFAMAVVAIAAMGVSLQAEEKEAPKGKTIAAIAVGNKNFSTLVTALKAAGLVETFQGEGPYTVFAPTNAAFAKIDKDTLDAVLKDKEKLTAILKAHVVKGSVMAGDVVKLNGKEVETLGGAKFKVTVEGDKVMIGNANVTKTDIKASNGVIHVIDTVLMP